MKPPRARLRAVDRLRAHSVSELTLWLRFPEVWIYSKILSGDMPNGKPILVVFVP